LVERDLGRCDSEPLKRHVSVWRELGYLALEVLPGTDTGRVMITELVDEHWLAGCDDRLRHGVCERFRAVAAEHSERHIPLLGDSLDHTSDRVLFGEDMDLDGLVAPEVPPIEFGGVCESVLEVVVRARSDDPAGTVCDPVVRDVTATA